MLRIMPDLDCLTTVTQYWSPVSVEKVNSFTMFDFVFWDDFFELKKERREEGGGILKPILTLTILSYTASYLIPITLLKMPKID